MFKYHCLNPIAHIGLQRFDAKYTRTDDVNEAEGILVRSASMHEMELSDNLLAVARAGAGVNNIPLDKCAENGIVVFNTPGANANGVKELVIAGMLLASRDVIGGVEWVKSAAGDEKILRGLLCAGTGFPEYLLFNQSETSGDHENTLALTKIAEDRQDTFKDAFNDIHRFVVAIAGGDPATIDDGELIFPEINTMSEKAKAETYVGRDSVSNASDSAGNVGSSNCIEDQILKRD